MERNCATYWGPKTERNENLMRCTDCVFEKKASEEFPCNECYNKRHFRRKGKSTIHYNSIVTTNTINTIARPVNTFAIMTPAAIKNVIFNDPATIVFWSDGTKTVVKVQDGEPYDAEKGLAMAISKKALGNQGNYCNVFKKWLPEEEEDDSKKIELLYNGAALERECKEAMETIVKFVKSGSNFSAKKGV